MLDRWLAPHFYKEFTAKTRAQAYAGKGVPILQGRPRRCASQQSNALYSVLTLGLADERVEALVEPAPLAVARRRLNCDKNPAARHSSFMESILPLRALALASREAGDRKAGASAKRAAEIFLKRRLFRRERDGRIMRREFTELHYPLYWHYDVLHRLKVMAEAGFVGDPRCQEALDFLETRRLPDGGWPAEKRYYTVAARTGNRERVDWGRASKRRMNEWVTVDALAVLRAAGRFEA